MDKQSAARQLSAYCLWLTQQLPSDNLEKRAHVTETLAKLASTLYARPNLTEALQIVYPSLSAEQRDKLAHQLISALVEKQAAVLRTSLGQTNHQSAGMGPSGGKSSPQTKTVRCKTAAEDLADTLSGTN